ncbi:primase-helicase family protein [Mesorhizobium sp. M0088]|uniref:primase-helicase family protein n=1 Tax=Mesorhizobium sp. M0088 TaxID=2956873 RepID=UPI00333CE774
MIDLQHFHENWLGQSGFACVFSVKGNSRSFAWPQEADELGLFANEVDKHDNVYVSWCLFDQPNRRAEHTSFVPGVLFDVDLNTGKHAAKNYPESEGEALELLARSPLPNPTRVIRSGGGLYLHYLFDEPFRIETQQDRARVSSVLKGMHSLLQSTFAASDRKLDNVSDLARVTRPVGAINHKYGTSITVQIAEAGGDRYRIEQLEALIGLGAIPSKSRQTTQAPTKKSEADGSFELAERHCGFLQRLTSTPDQVTEPEWYAAATIAARCEDGETRFHELSALDPARYNEAETAKKLRQAAEARPRTCASIENDLGCTACERCPFKASDIASPYALARGDEKLLELQRSYVLAGDTDSYMCITRDEPALARQSFDNQYAHRVAKPHLDFIRDRRSPKVKLIDYVPGDHRLIIDQNGTLVLNSWRAGGVSAAAGNCSVIQQHFDYLLPNHDERDWLYKYLAHLLQKPSVKIESAITLIGGQGVGKSFVAKLLKELFGESNVFVDDCGLHASDYKQALGNRQVLVIEEMATANRWEVSNSFKPWVTAEKVLASDKFIRSHLVRTPRGIFTLTNHAVPASLEKDDRRNAVFRIDAHQMPQPYYELLWDIGLKQAACFKAWLQEMDISAWSPNSRPPMTEAKREIILSSRTSAAMEIEDLVRSGDGELVTLNDVMRWLNTPLGQSQFSLKQVRAAMNELGYRKLDKTKLSGGRTVDLWAVSEVEGWLMSDHSARKTHYEGRRTSTGKTLAVISSIQGSPVPERFHS